MNIYISKNNEKWLRVQNSSMSGIINKLLDEARAGKHGPHVIAPEEVSSNIRPNLRSDSSVPMTPENPFQLTDTPICCLDKQAPCRHWSFDGLSGMWKNGITGDTKEIF